MAPLSIAALRSQIKSGKLAPLYLFVGDDAKLVDRMIDGIEGTIEEGDRPFAIERLYAGEETAGPIDIAAAARVYPMLGDRRIVFVLRAERLLKPKRAASKTAEPAEGEEAPEAAEEGSVDFAPLDEYVGAPVDSTTLVFVATEIDRTRKFTKRLYEKAQVVEFGDKAIEGRSEAAALVHEELARDGKTIEPEALSLLLQRSAGDVTKLRGDLERLLLYAADDRKISIAQVAEIAVEGHAIDEWAVVDAIAERNAARALREAAFRLERGDSPHALVGQIRWWVSQKLVQNAPERVPRAIDALLRTDLALKSSGGDDRILIERLIVELAGK